MKYEYKTHDVYRGYGWIEPLTDSEDSLIEDHLARRICDELNTLQSECERLRKDVASLVEALTELCDEIDKHAIHDAISKTSISWFKRKARKALAAHRKQGGKAWRVL